MRLYILFLLILILIYNSVECQSYVYKKNVFGQVEVFASSYGQPTGQPVARIKKNLWGYLEIENVQGNSNFGSNVNQTNRIPDYSSYRTNFTPIINSINTSNIFIQNNLIVSNNNNNNNNSTEADNASFEKRFRDVVISGNEEAANRLQDVKNLFNQFTNKPQELSDGWHDIVTFSENTIDLPNIPSHRVKTVFSGYAKIYNNRIIEVIEYLNNGNNLIFFDATTVVSNSIKDCQAIYKYDNSATNFSNVFFINALFDPKKNTAPPKLSSYSFTSEGSRILITVYKNNPDVYGTDGDNLLNILRVNDDKFYNLPGTYYYTARDISRKWKGSFTLTENSSSGIKLNLQ